MNKLRYAVSLLLVFLLLFISGCSVDNSNNTVLISEDSDFDYASDMQVMYNNGGTHVPVTKSDTGYYYVGSEDIVIYIDKESKKATPLCSKPNCMHDDPNTCDAYFDIAVDVDSSLGTFGTAIQYYAGSLYMVCGEYDESYIEYNTYLLKMSEDGSNRERVTDYFDYEFNSWFIHRGYFYYVTDSSILRIPLDNPKSEPEVVYHTDNFLKDNTGTFQAMCAYENYLYSVLDERDEEGASMGITSIYVNLDTLESGTLPYIDDNQTFLSQFCNKKLIMEYTDEKSNEEVRVIAELDGSDYQELFRCDYDNAEALTNDGKYFYSDNRLAASKGEADGQVITVYDLNMNKVDSFKLPDSGISVCNFFNPQDEDYFILEALNDEGERILVMADKSQIGSIGGDTIEYTELCKLDWYEITDAPYVAE